jgi:hypothetical protein
MFALIAERVRQFVPFPRPIRRNALVKTQNKNTGDRVIALPPAFLILIDGFDLTHRLFCTPRKYNQSKNDRAPAASALFARSCPSLFLSINQANISKKHHSAIFLRVNT